VLVAGALRGASPPESYALLDVATGRLIRSSSLEIAPAPPGSALKPLVLTALLDAGKLKPTEVFPCSGEWKLAGRSFACSHPRISSVDLPTAIAYSCNEYVARVAARFAPGELQGALGRYGLAAEAASGAQANQLQALGQEHVAVTARTLAMAYRKLAATAPPLIREGLEAAVEFGTAQLARVEGVRVAGKTGSAAGRYAWFAGFAPSRTPRFAIAVLVEGRAGGSDAAPIAARLLKEVL
jgi:cell division protein FtsI/penicillin-binding protein 2